MTKRFISFILALVFVAAMVPVFTVEAAQTDGYSADDALAFAQRNWNSGKGLCAEFASDCLRNGGVDDTYEARVVNLYNELINNGWGKAYKLKLTKGDNGSVRLADNKGKVEAGDPVFYYCNHCKTFDHVVICNGFNKDGYMIDYAHNSAHNGNKRSYTYNHCGGDSWTVYSIRMNEGETLYGGKTNVDAPKITEIRNVEKGVYLEWEEIPGATKYRLYRREPGKSWKVVKNTKGTYFTDEKAVNGKEYIYTVRAYKGNVRSAYYYGKKIKFLDQTKFTSISNQDSGIKLNWTKNLSADGYYLYRKVNNGKWRRYKDITRANISSYTDENVVNGNGYRYRILAYTDNGYRSSYSHTGVGIRYLLTPEAIRARNSEEGISLIWNPVSSATSYRVYRSGSENSHWKYVDTVKSNRYFDSNVASGSYYKYTVRAKNGKSLSSYDKNTKEIGFLSAPILLGTQSVSDGIKVQWEPVAGATSYRVYHKAVGQNGWQFIGTADDISEFIDTSVEKGVTYNYTVRAKLGNNLSSYDKDGTFCEFVG